MHIGIIGAGLIGGSVARALRVADPAIRITIIEASPDLAAQAAVLGLGDVCTDDAGTLHDCDIVMLATSVARFHKIAAQIPCRAGMIITDAASVKQAAIDAIAPHLPAGVVFVPAHPIAGTEHSGLKAGFPELFRGKWTILTPAADTPASAVDTVTQLWTSMGARVAVMDAATHDRAFATTSHVPHALAFSLMTMGAAEDARNGGQLLAYAANSFGDYTRVASSDPDLWADIFLHNRAALTDSLTQMQDHLAMIRDWIAANDRTALHDFMSKARASRRAMIALRDAHSVGF